LPASRPLRPNATSSIKPEVHNVAHNCRGAQLISQWGPGAKPLVRGSGGGIPPESDDDLLIQQKIICTHSIVKRVCHISLRNSSFVPKPHFLRGLAGRILAFCGPRVMHPHVAQRRRRRTEPRSRGICTQNVVKIGPAIQEIC